MELEVIDTSECINKYLDLNGYDVNTTEVTLDFNYFNEHYPESVSTFTNNPAMIIDMVKNHLLRGVKRYISVQIINFSGNVVSIRDIRNSHIGRMINIDCVVRKVSDIKQEIVYAGYRCSQCNAAIPLYEVDERMIRPSTVKCPINDKHTKFILEPELCQYRDIQVITAQERQVEGGKQPKSIMCVISSGIVDKLQAGNRVRITGYVKVKVDKKNIAYLSLEVLNVVYDDDDFSEVTLSEEDIKEIKEFSDTEDVYTKFVNSINPNIYGYDEVKLGLVLSMFGGVTYNYDDGTRVRGESHILLCGDPSTAKSQLIYSVSKIMPRVIYTSGKSTSAAGLTAAAIKDELDGKWTLEAGALPLANGGVVVCDEFDKLGPEDRSALHEAMELGSISVNKAGLSEKLQTETTLIAAANPKSGRFIPSIPLREQLDLPPSLISRFDLIFTILDQTDEEKDAVVARHVLSSRMKSSTSVDRPLSIEFMRKYITYAKQVNPQLSEEASKYLSRTYTSLRKDEETYITVRQLDALIRLSEASARIKLREEVKMEDARRAVRLFFASMKSASLSDRVDVTLFDSTSSRQDIMNKEYVLMMVNNQNYDMKDLCNLLVKNRGLDWDSANDLLIEMLNEKLIKVIRIPEEKRSYVAKL